MIADQIFQEKLDLLDDIAMGYEVAVIPLFKQDYLNEFYDFYEVKDRTSKLVPSEEDFDGALRSMTGEYRWKEIAGKTKELFGLPSRVMYFEDVKRLREELDGPDGLAPFFFVFDMMFCEYEEYTLCFLYGTNN